MKLKTSHACECGTILCFAVYSILIDFIYYYMKFCPVFPFHIAKPREKNLFNMFQIIYNSFSLSPFWFAATFYWTAVETKNRVQNVHYFQSFDCKWPVLCMTSNIKEFTMEISWKGWNQYKKWSSTGVFFCKSRSFVIFKNNFKISTEQLRKYLKFYVIFFLLIC